MKLYSYLMKARKNLFLSLLCVGIFLVCTGCIADQVLNPKAYIWIKESIVSIIINIGVALISSALTIYFIKYDIFGLIQKDTMSELGVKNITKGRDSIFNSDSNNILFHYKDWNEFFASAKPKEISILGISMYSFFETSKLFNPLIELALKGYKVTIIFANPQSEELSLQEETEDKKNILKKHINLITTKFTELINKHPKKEKIYKNISLHYSDTLPRVFMVVSGTKMVVTSYLFEGPFEAPTLILEDIGEKSIFRNYKSYFNSILTRYSKKIDIFIRNKGIEECASDIKYES